MKDTIFAIMTAGIICSIAGSLVSSKSASEKLLRLLTGVFMAITVISPLATISFSNITGYWDDLNAQGDSYATSGKIMAEDSICAIIKAQSKAYILDKANRMGLDIAVEVALDEGNNSVPCEVTVTGALSPYAKSILGAYIAENLGIAKENQKWK